LDLGLLRRCGVDGGVAGGTFAPGTPHSKEVAGDLVPLIDGDRLCGVCRRGVWLRAARALGVGLRLGARLAGVEERRFGADLGVLGTSSDMWPANETRRLLGGVGLLPRLVPNLPRFRIEETGDSNSVGAAEAEDAKSRSRAVAKR